MRDVVTLIEPSMSVVSISQPEPALLSLNVVAVYRDENDARNAVLALESIDADDLAVGLTVLGTSGARPSDDDTAIRGLDPEGVTADIAPRAAKGAIIGAVVGAVVVGGAAALFAGGAAALGGALGGLLLGAVIGAVWGAFARMGGSDAYRQTFVEPSSDSCMLVSLHTADTEAAERGRQVLAANADRAPYVVRSDHDGLDVI
ncbi:MAG: hypothetical protein ABWZ99_14415 [Ilumatobacteraceae bacterium]